MTDDAASESAMQERCRALVEREVGTCVSTLIYTLAHAFDTVPRGDLANLCEQAWELSTPIQDYEEAARDAGWKTADMTPGLFVNESEKDDDTGQCLSFQAGRTGREGWAELCDEFGIEPFDREVFEHWTVSNWLADKLESLGEKVDRDVSGLIVWARTTTGQAILLDSVIREIVRELHKPARAEG